MTMIGGSVTVNDDETHSGTGLALALFEAKRAAGRTTLDRITRSFSLNDGESNVFAGDLVAAGKWQRVRMLRQWAGDASAWAPVLVEYIQANAVVKAADGAELRIA